MSLQPLTSREPERSGKVVPLLPGPVFDGSRPAAPRAERDRALGWNWLAVSILAHLILVEALLLGLSAPEAPPPVPLLQITLIPEGPGSAGAAGGSNAASEAPPPQAEAPPPAPQPEPAPPVAETPPEPTPPIAEAPPPEPVPVPKIETPPPPPPPPVQAVEPPPPAPELKPEPVPEPPKPPPEKPRVVQTKPKPKPKPEIARETPPTPSPPQPRPAPPVAALTPPAPTATGTPGPEGAPKHGLGTEGQGKGAIGQSAGPGDEYLERLYKHLLRFKQYPADAQRRKEQGSVMVGFTIARDGTLTNPHIEKSSGFTAIDEATVDMLKRASPAPPLPDSFKASEARVKIPINYKLGVADELF